MCDKQTIKCFFSGFFSVFRFGSIEIERPKPKDIATYVFNIEDYINTAYENLKNSHERN